MFSIGSLTVSAVLLAGLFGLRYVEMNRGGRFFPRVRKTLDYLSLHAVRYFTKELPTSISVWVARVVLHVTHIFSLILLKLVQFIEGHLHIAVHKVRGKRADLVKKEATSSYFEDVKRHKQEVRKTIEELGEIEK